MSFIKRVLNLVAITIVSLLLITAGILLSFRISPVSARVAHNACHVVGYETVFCQKTQDESYYYFTVVGVRGQEVVQLTHRIPKKIIGQYEL